MDPRPADPVLDPRLVEEAVLLALENHGGAMMRRFRRERDALYVLEEPESRERRFGTLHARWFGALRLFDPIAIALAERPGIGAGVSRCLVVRARTPADEGADLRALEGDSGAGPPALVIQLRPQSLLQCESLLALMRHELEHVADLLDPAFGCVPGSTPPAGPSPGSVLRQRYRAAWNTTVDGRLAACGVLPESRLQEGRREFLQAFRMLGEEAPAAFERLFNGPRPTHADLWNFAADPSRVPGAPPARLPGRPERCPVCRFPTTAFRPGAADLPDRVVGAIRADFPAWSPPQGLCLQCADLYEARAGTGAGEAGYGLQPCRTRM